MFSLGFTVFFQLLNTTKAFKKVVSEEKEQQK